MQMEKPYVIGIDMGGTNTVFGIVDARGNVIAKGAIKTDNPDIKEYIHELKVELDKQIELVGGIEKIKGITKSLNNVIPILLNFKIFFIFTSCRRCSFICFFWCFFIFCIKVFFCFTIIFI